MSKHKSRLWLVVTEPVFRRTPVLADYFDQQEIAGILMGHGIDKFYMVSRSLDESGDA